MLKNPYLTLTIVLSSFALAPLLYPGYFITHTGFAPLWNIADLRTQSQLIGWIPPYSFDVDIFRGPSLLLYYLAAIIPFSPVITIKLFVSLSWVGGTVGVFLWLRSWLGDAGAMIAALVYCYQPFQITTIYIRGSWLEMIFWGMLPWVLLITTYLTTHPQVVIVIISTIAWLILGNIQLGLTIWGWLFTTALLTIVHFKQSFRPILAATIGTSAAIGLAFVFRSISDSPIQFIDHLLYPYQLISASWGVGVSHPGWQDGLSFQIGVAGLGLTLMTIFLWQYPTTISHNIAKSTDPRLLFFCGVTLLLCFMQLTLAQSIWQISGLGITLTYPWQLMGFVGLSLATLAGATAWLNHTLTQLPTLAAVILLIILSSYHYLDPHYIQTDLIPPPPQAVYGNQQILLLDYEFTIEISDNIAGLPPKTTTIPVSLHGPLQPNNTLYVQAVWQPLQALQQNWKLFIHLTDMNGTMIAQFDGYPQFATTSQANNYTAQWIPGQLIDDRYPIQIPADLPPGPYQIGMGFYDETTFARIPVATDSEGRVFLTVE